MKWLKNIFREIFGLSGGIGDHDSESVGLEQHAQNVLNRLIVLEDQNQVHRFRHAGFRSKTFILASRSGALNGLAT